MNSDRFNNVLETTLKKCIDTLSVKSNEYATVISSSSLSGCSASSNGLVVTLTNLTNNCSITLSKQSRITSIEFKYE